LLSLMRIVIAMLPRSRARAACSPRSPSSSTPVSFDIMSGPNSG
jgi:hypothetical protein